MQLDQHRIVIRERSFVDLLDLALRVIRAYAAPLTGLLVLGVAPAMILNAYLLSDRDVQLHEAIIPFDYLGPLGLLMLVEIPLVTAPITLYLGHSLFMEKPQARQLVKEFFLSLPQMILFQVILRFFLVMCIISWLLLFGAWPYMSEVILLERNPLFRRRPGQMTTFRRIRALHDGVMGDLFSRWLGSIACGGVLFASLFFSCLVLCGLLLNEWEWEGPVFTVICPLCLWIVIGVIAVVRYLGYLDLRIRREGWEVELLMRAEAARLTRLPV